MLLNRGGGDFERKPTQSEGVPVAAGDFNNDGKLDLVVGISFPNNHRELAILPGNGDGTFGRPLGLKGIVGMAAVADFNGDGNLDLAVATDASGVLILLGNGDGTFQPPVAHTTGAEPVSLAVADLNGDGIPDVIVSDTNYDRPALSILLGNGDGTFQPQLTYTLANSSTLAVGDFNGDGLPDLAVAALAPGSVSILLGNGDGTFRQGAAYLQGTAFGSIITADFNEDGKLDLMVSVYGQHPSLLTMLGNGDGSFQPPSTYPAIGLLVDAADFYGDGHQDVAVNSNVFAPGSGYLLLLPGNGRGGFLQAPGYHGGPEPAALASADFNGDGNPDLAVADASAGTVSILLGDGLGAFHNAGSYAAGRNPVCIAVADFNGDGKLDLAVGDHPDYQTSLGAVSILLGIGDGSFQAPASYPIAGGADGIAIGKFNGEATPDLVTADGDSHSVSLLLGNGNGTFGPATNFSAGPVPVSVAVADFNGDGNADVAAVNGIGQGAIAILLGNGDGTLSPPVDSPQVFLPIALVAADFNGDGVEDLAVAMGCCGDALGIAVLLGKGDGTFWPPATYYQTYFGALSLAVADFDGDGNLDLAVAAGSIVSILPGNGDGTFGGPIGFLTPYSEIGNRPNAGPAFLTADFNGDGKPDLAVVANGIRVLTNTTR